MLPFINKLGCLTELNKKDYFTKQPTFLKSELRHQLQHNKLLGLTLFKRKT